VNKITVFMLREVAFQLNTKCETPSWKQFLIIGAGAKTLDFGTGA